MILYPLAELQTNTNTNKEEGSCSPPLCWCARRTCLRESCLISEKGSRLLHGPAYLPSHGIDIRFYRMLVLPDSVSGRLVGLIRENRYSSNFLKGAELPIQ